jgi:hypothetical protein
MKETNPHLDALTDIKSMMEKSSRFISLSGLSGISAGLCALIGAWFAHDIIDNSRSTIFQLKGIATKAYTENPEGLKAFMGTKLFYIGIATFIAAFVLALFFTYLRSQKNNIPIWGTTARRLIINVSIPMLVGGIYLLKLIENGTYGLIAPGCLIFYGLALVNASKYTLGEVRFLGYGQLILGVISSWYIGYGLYFWAMGFGVLHIVYGFVMWWKYERN